MGSELLDQWPRVREHHLYVEVPEPGVELGDREVGVRVVGRRPILNPLFCGRFSGMPPAAVAVVLLDHALDHQAFCPGDFGTYLRLYFQAKKVVRDRAKARAIVDAFADLVVDTQRVKADRSSRLPDVYTSLMIGAGEFERALGCIRQAIWGMDLGVRGFEDIVGPLSVIPYLDPSRWETSVMRFAIPLRGIAASSGFHIHALAEYHHEAITRGFRDLAARVRDPRAFNEVLRDFREELTALGLVEEEAASEEGDREIGRGKGVPEDGNVLFYMQLAESYHIPVERLQMERDGSLYPHSHTPWEVGQPVQEIDYWNSLGIRIMPGTTQMWKRRESEVYDQRERVPDCLIAIDSSGSMPNPARGLSHAVLGAGCAADAYLREGARVGVVNFSDAVEGDEAVLGYTRDRRKVFEALSRYFQGGSMPNLEGMKGLLKPDSDLLMITDMALENLKELIAYLQGVANRVTVIYMGPNEYSAEFGASVRDMPNITLYSVRSQEDIPKIVLGKVKKDLKVGGDGYRPL